MYRTDSEALGKSEYGNLTSKQYAAVLVVDIDQPGEAGGHPADLALYVRNVVRVLVEHNIGPAWVGVNLISGKGQFIWLIAPVYTDASGKSSQMKLLAAATHTLGVLCP
ncbi:replication initiation protein [Corynebacterium striatum]